MSHIITKDELRREARRARDFRLGARLWKQRKAAKEKQRESEEETGDSKGEADGNGG